jgi:hypothetical protein
VDLYHYASVDDRADTLRNQIVQADRAGHGAQAHTLFLQDMCR